MTAGHKHRMLALRAESKRLWLLRRTLWRTRNLEWVERSRLVFGPTDDPLVWRLSILSLLHGMTGLTVVVITDTGEEGQ